MILTFEPSITINELLFLVSNIASCFASSVLSLITIPPEASDVPLTSVANCNVIFVSIEILEELFKGDLEINVNGEAVVGGL